MKRKAEAADDESNRPAKLLSYSEYLTECGLSDPYAATTINTAEKPAVETKKNLLPDFFTSDDNYYLSSGSWDHQGKVLSYLTKDRSGRLADIFARAHQFKSQLDAELEDALALHNFYVLHEVLTPKLGTLSVLPNELILMILRFLTPSELGRVSCVCSTMYNLTDTNQLWQPHVQNHCITSETSTIQRNDVRNLKFSPMKESYVLKQIVFRNWSTAHSRMKPIDSAGMCYTFHCHDNVLVSAPSTRDLVVSVRDKGVWKMKGRTAPMAVNSRPSRGGVTATSSRIACVNRDSGVFIYDMSTLSSIRTIETESQYKQIVALDEYIYVCAGHNEVCAYDERSGKSVFLHRHSNRHSSIVSMDAEGMYCAFATGYAAVVMDFRLTERLIVHNTTYADLVKIKKGRLLVAGTYNISYAIHDIGNIDELEFNYAKIRANEYNTTVQTECVDFNDHAVVFGSRNGNIYVESRRKKSPSDVCHVIDGWADNHPIEELEVDDFRIYSRSDALVVKEWDFTYFYFVSFSLRLCFD